MSIQQQEFSRFIKYKSDIDSKIRKNQVVVRRVDKLKSLRGSLISYLSNKNLVCLTYNDKKEFGLQSYTYYLKNDTIVLVTYKLFYSEEPNENEIEAFKKKYYKNNEIDFLKAPLMISNESTYYFNLNKIIKAESKSFGKPYVENEGQIYLQNQAILLNLKLLKEELN